MKNLFFETIDINKAKQMIANCPKDEIVILCPHYSINIQSKYNDESIDLDWLDFQKILDCPIMISDYDDLIADPHNITE